MKKTIYAIIMCIGLLFSGIANAQVTTASISGKITTDTKEALLGVNVKATHVPTGTVYWATTNQNGSYYFPNLRIGGPYKIEFKYVGFNSEEANNISLTLGEERTLNVTLREESKALSEVLVIGQKNPVISANRTGAQEIITRDKLDKLPTINRSLTDFTRLTPMSSGSNFAGVSYRYNNVTVDGASFNNSFGLSSSLGASGTEPISLEALEQVQVMIAPYDVRNGGFTGAGINSVTKSGTNDVHASAYYYVKSPALVGYRIKNNVLPVSEFSNKQYGLSISGPIIKNKLFFYLNGELDRQETPITYTTDNSLAKAATLQGISDFLNQQLNYSPGSYNLAKYNTQADRLTARLDWNVNSKNALSLKYYHLKSFTTNKPSTSGAPKNGRGPNEYAIPFSSVFYRSNNNFDIVIMDLNTTINSEMSNYFKVGYSRLRDFRDMDGGFFPQVDILNGDGTNLMAMTTFGTEGNSYNNKLNTDIWQIQNNFVWNKGNHQLTLGTQSDFRKFANGFAQNYPGAWVFTSVDDFKFNVLATKDYMAAHNGSLTGFDITQFNPSTYGLNPINGGIANIKGASNTTYTQKYSIGDSFPFAYVDVIQLGFYIQDKWTLSSNLNFTFGLRADIPVFTTDLAANDKVAAETYRDGMKVDVSKYPNAKLQLSPRLGFNYRPLDDESLQIRGGSGLFTGTPPYVWLSNQAGNNGVLFGDISISSDKLKTLGFTGNIDQFKPAAGSATRADINVTDPKFKYPMIWKNNLAADYKFGDGWIATVELLYSKDINGIYHDNIGKEISDKFVNDGSGQNARPFYTGAYYSDLAGNQKAANNVIMLRNTNKGHAFSSSFQLQKSFTTGVLKGLDVNGSYSFSHAKGVTDGSSSTATSSWRYRASLNPNAQEVSYSAGAVNGRVLLSASYTANWGKSASTSFGVIYQRYRPFRYSYVYSGDANGDGLTDNDLIYIPKSLDEIKGNLLATGFDSQQKAWEALDNFISQDPYLKNRRGQFAERNGAVAPYANQLDFSVNHDIHIFQGNGRPHTIRLSASIQNFLNLMNKKWGVQETTMYGSSGSPQYQFLTIAEKASSINNYTVKYSMDKALKETFKDNVGDVSRWQMQVGIKYIF
jgi:hypothetical protein